MFRAHVLIIRRSKLHYTASGIITLSNKSCVYLVIKIVRSLFTLQLIVESTKNNTNTSQVEHSIHSQ